MLALVDKNEISTALGVQEDSGAEIIGIGGGTILEVSKGRVRNVQAFNDPGPVGRPSNTVGNMSKLDDELWENLGKTGWGLLRQ
jgi:3-hydroxybutyrate dehydrogenase